MEKPKKKSPEDFKGFGLQDYERTQVSRFYNQCWDDREKWLKEKMMSVEEIYYCLRCNKKVKDYEAIKMHAGCGGTLTTKKPNIGMTRYE